MNTEKKWTALGVLLGVTLMATIGAVLVGVDSDDRPQPQDTQGRSLIKINEILYNSIQGKGTNQINTSSVGTNAISGSVNVTNALNIGTQIFNTNQFIRVNNTTAYSANQFMGPSTTATNLPMAIGVTTVPGGSGIIEQIRFNTFNNAWTGINVVFYLSTNITAQADGTAYTFYMTNAWARIGPPVNIPLQAGTDCAFGAVGMDGGLHIKFQCAPGDTNLYYNLIVPSGLTPVAYQTNWIQVQSRAWNY